MDLLAMEARPGLILLNGNPTLAAFKKLYASDLNPWQLDSYSSAHNLDRMLWHEQGFLSRAGARVPVAGFPFLRTRFSHKR
jgi:hypothetical protein